MNKVTRSRHVQSVAQTVKNDPYDALIFGGTLYILGTVIVLGFLM